MKKRRRFPRTIDPARVGRYPTSCFAGGGFVWDAVLEYRVWCHPERGAPDTEDGNDYCYAFASYPAALRFSKKFPGAEEPLALILQKEYIDEPAPRQYSHVKKRRITEWPVDINHKGHEGTRRNTKAIQLFSLDDRPSDHGNCETALTSALTVRF